MVPRYDVKLNLSSPLIPAMPPPTAPARPNPGCKPVQYAYLPKSNYCRRAHVHTYTYEYTHTRTHTRVHLTIARDIILFGEHLVHIGLVKPVARHERKTMSDVNLCTRLLNLIMGHATSYPKLIAWTDSSEKIWSKCTCTTNLDYLFSKCEFLNMFWMCLI